MPKFLTLAALAVAVILISSVPVQGQSRSCMDRQSALEHFAEKYGERPVAIGLANNGGVVEILADRARDSWTIVITMPDGRTCLVLAGEYWELVYPDPVGDRL